MSEFWKQKMRTWVYIFDHNKDGLITEKDFADMARSFADSCEASPEIKEKLVKTFTNAFQKLTKAADPRTGKGLTVPVFIESIRQQLYDPELIISYVHLLRGLFELVDVNHDGYLDPEEHKKLFKDCGIPDGKFDNMVAFNAIDRNKDGLVSFDEYIASCMEFLFSEDESSPLKFFFGPLIDEAEYPSRFD